MQTKLRAQGIGQFGPENKPLEVSAHYHQNTYKTLENPWGYRG